MADVADDPANDRFTVTVDGDLAGFAQYRRRPGALAFVHTEIDPAFGGRGLGTELIAGALAGARAQGADVLPFCPFVKAYLERHPEDLDLVPAGRRGEFGLPAHA